MIKEVKNVEDANKCDELLTKLILDERKYNDLIDDDGNTYELKVITSNKIIINKSIINKVNYLIIVNYKTIFDINYARSMSNLNRKIEAQLEQNEIMRQRSLYYASNPYVKK